jgi:hypothetical protein
MKMKFFIGTSLSMIALGSSPAITLFTKGAKFNGHELTFFMDHNVAALLFGNNLPSKMSPKCLSSMSVSSSGMGGVLVKNVSIIKEVLLGAQADEMSLAKPEKPQSAIFLISRKTAHDVALLTPGEFVHEDTVSVLGMGPAAPEFVSMVAEKIGKKHKKVGPTDLEAVFALLGVNHHKQDFDAKTPLHEMQARATGEEAFS